MYHAPKQPLSVGQTLDNGFRLFRSKLSGLIILAVISALPSMLLTLLEFALASGADPEVIAPTPPAVLVGYLVVGLLSVAVYAAMTHYLCVLQGGENATAIQSLRQGLARTPIVIIAGILYGIAAMVGFLLLLIPGIWISILFMFFVIPIVTVNAGPIAALKDSTATIKGHWWRSFLVVSIIFMLVIALYIALFGMIAIVAGVTMAGALTLSENLAFGTIAVIAVGQFIASALISPMINALYVVLYYDLKLRHSGDDLERRLEEA